jgi:Tol biopolymer transport system component
VSPDGKWLAFASKQQGTWDLYIARTANPGSAIRVTEFSDDEWDPQWHPQGKMLVFAMTTQDGPRIMGMCLFGELN